MARAATASPPPLFMKTWIGAADFRLNFSSPPFTSLTRSALITSLIQMSRFATFAPLGKVLRQPYHPILKNGRVVVMKALIRKITPPRLIGAYHFMLAYGAAA